MLQAALKGSRFAGTALAKLGKFLAGDAKGWDRALRLGPDIVFGGLEAVMTPGDIGDKAIAGLSTAIPSLAGGRALSMLAPRNQIGLANALDMAGSIAGDFGGRALGEQVLRGKDSLIGTGRGLTPYERMNEEQQRLFAEQVKNQTLAQLGLLPGSTQSYLIDQGLA